MSPVIDIVLPVTNLVAVSAFPEREPYTVETFRFLFSVQRSSTDVYVSDALAPSTVIPAPLADIEFSAPFATVIFKSATSNVVELTEVVVPLTVKFPLIIELPDIDILALVISSLVNVPFTETLLNVTSLVVETGCPIAKLT